MKLSKIIDEGEWQGDYWPVEFTRSGVDVQFKTGRYFRGYKLSNGALTLIEDNASDPINLGNLREIFGQYGDLDVFAQPKGRCPLIIKSIECDSWHGRILITTKKTKKQDRSIGKFTAVLDRAP